MKPRKIGLMRESLPNVAVILLAAGGSVRLGKPKQLIPFKGLSLIRHIAKISVASEAQSVHVVLGAYAELLKLQLLGLPVRIVFNNRWGEGVSSSIRAGIDSIDRSAKAVLLVLCDQPLVSPRLLNRMIESYHLKHPPIVASQYASTLGVPALFDRSLFPELTRLSGDRGAKHIIMNHRNKTISIPFPEGIVDIDSFEDEINLSRILKA
jgi:molybdenum cofactor cytidylyltransferase